MGFKISKHNNLISDIDNLIKNHESFERKNSGRYDVDRLVYK